MIHHHGVLHLASKSKDRKQLSAEQVAAQNRALGMIERKENYEMPSNTLRRMLHRMEEFNSIKNMLNTEYVRYHTDRCQRRHYQRDIDSHQSAVKLICEDVANCKMVVW